MNAMTDAETIAALRAENTRLLAELEQAEAPTGGAFKPFSWLHHGAQLLPGADTVCRARDIAQGLALVLELVYDSELTAECCDEAPYLGCAERGDLMRFAATAAKMLAEEAARDCDRLNNVTSERARRG